MQLRFRLLTPEASPPSRAHPDDAGLDICASEATTILPGGRASVGTGIALEIPAGHAGLVLPRSGLAARHGIALVNSPGLIDSGYRGEIRVLLLNTDASEPFEVRPGDRIAQLLVTQYAGVEPLAADELSDSARGEGGFGSTGIGGPQPTG
ncbi:MAG: dUTP diphosphatase [Solirubrobacterales bacterium]